MRCHWQLAARSLGWDRNPLRRGIDRAETVVMTMLLAALITVGPLLAVLASRATDVGALREQHAERGWHQVTAVLTQSAGQAVIDSGQMDVAWVRARWTGRGDRQRTGLVAAPLNAPAGQRVEVWLTQAGQRANAPLSAADVRVRVLCAAGLAFIGWFAVLELAAVGVRVVADRRRMAGWQREWAAFGSASFPPG
jgi:hypothetical protein